MTKNVAIWLVLFAAVAYSYAQPEQRSGWPVSLAPETGAFHADNLTWYRPAGGEPVIAYGSNSTIGLLNMEGEFLDGWPRAVYRPNEQYPFLVKGPRMGDMDGDGRPEIAVLEYDSTQIYRRLVFSFVGDTLHEFTLEYHVEPLEIAGAHVAQTPLFVDLNDDGLDELFALTPDSIYCTTADGSQYSGFPWASNDTLSAYNAGIVVGAGENWSYDQPLICWGTYHGVHARFLGDNDEVDGFPFALDFAGIGYSPLNLFSINGDWYIYQNGANSQRHLITSAAQEYGSYPLPVLSTDADAYNVAMGDNNADGDIEFFQQSLQGEILVYNIDGTYENGFPFVVEENGAGQNDAIVSLENGAGLLYFRAHFMWGDFENWHVRLLGFQGTNLLPGFPITVANPPDTFSPSNTVAVIPRYDIIHIIVSVFPALVYVFDYQLPEGMVVDKLVWPMPGNTAGGNRFYSPRPSTLHVEDSGGTTSSMPVEYHLSDPFPNPFNSEIRLNIELPDTTPVTMEVVDVLGRTVYSERFAPEHAGKNPWSWDGTTEGGTRVATGTYWIRIAEARDVSKKIVLLK